MRTDLRGRHVRGSSFAAALGVGVIAFLVCAATQTQGMDLRADGLWLLGTQILRDGHPVHLRVETADGPLRYFLLLPMSWLLGSSAQTLAMLRAALDAIVAVGGFLWLSQLGAGRRAWVFPLGVVALGPVPVEVLLLLTLLWALDDPHIRVQASWNSALAGLSCALLVLLDLRAAPLALIPAALALWRPRNRPRQAARLILGTSVGMGTLLGVWLLCGASVEFLRNTLGLPVADLLDHVRDGQHWRWWETLVRGAWLSEPFAGLDTGESSLPTAGPAWLRAWAWRGLAALIGLSAVPWALSGRRGDRPAFVARAAIGCALGALFLRGDVTGLARAFLIGLPALILAGNPLGNARGPQRAALLLSCLLLVVLALPRLWLAAQRGRPELDLWDRARAGVALSPQRIHRLDQLMASIEGAAQTPTLIWPGHAGLHYVFDVPLLSREVHWRDGPMDLAGVLSDLRDRQPMAVLLGEGAGFSALALRSRHRPLWDEMRTHYRIVGASPGPADRFRILQRIDPPVLLEDLSLAERLPDVELNVANDVGPALRPDLEVGQSFRAGPMDFQGFAVRWSTRGANLRVPARVRVWARRGSEFNTLLAAQTLELLIAGDGARSYVRLPVEGSAGFELAVTVEVREDTAQELRLYWNRHSDRSDDRFPEGSALLDLQAVDADLYFLSF